MSLSQAEAISHTLLHVINNNTHGKILPYFWLTLWRRLFCVMDLKIDAGAMYAHLYVFF